MKRITTAVVAGAAVATLAYASASLLDVDSKPLQAGSDSVTCDANGVTVDWALEVDSNSVYWMTVSGIDDDCWNSGARLFAAIDGKRLEGLDGEGEVITKGDHKITFPAGQRPSPELINDVKIWFG